MSAEVARAAPELPGPIGCGDIAPWWNQGRHAAAFDAVGCRYVVLGFDPADPAAPTAAAALHAPRVRDADPRVCFFVIGRDPHQPAGEASVAPRCLRDPDGVIRRAYGVGSDGVWIVLNPMLRVIAVIALRPDGGDDLFRRLDALPPPTRSLGLELPPPILILSDAFEPALCRHLVDLFDRDGGRESGFMGEVAGRSVTKFDDAWKRRRDFLVADPDLIKGLHARISRRVVGEIWKAFHFKATRIERYLVACYDARDSGHFGPHRDDVVRATAHRRFAISIALDDDFDGGELTFPEFSDRTFRAPVGAALVFSCSLLHAVAPVRRGRRYVFLPFLYDEDAETIRQANLAPEAVP